MSWRPAQSRQHKTAVNRCPQWRKAAGRQEVKVPSCPPSPVDKQMLGKSRDPLDFSGPNPYGDRPGHNKALPSKPQASDLLVGCDGQLGPLLQRPQGRDLTVRDVGGHEVQQALQDHLGAIVHEVLLGGQFSQVILLGRGRAHQNKLWEAVPGHQASHTFRPRPWGLCALPDSPGARVCLVKP